MYVYVYNEHVRAVESQLEEFVIYIYMYISFIYVHLYT